MNAMYHLKAIADIVQHYYPETLHRLFIVNAPSAFVVMFKVVKPWLNARVMYIYIYAFYPCIYVNGSI
jgi:hypothetical protein